MGAGEWDAVIRMHLFTRSRVFLGVGLSGVIEPGPADAIDFLGCCGSGSNRRLARAGPQQSDPDDADQARRLFPRSHEMSSGIPRRRGA
ncbi:hypothetical protein [Aquabacterium sp.]|uniref:hypothetical protein n=1 Tax=Aquabacterium sp. TaxID=1872578 RepID=UPI002C5FA74D|nr:hypothetical protein [Aquabacterium sp.]HSW03561.1 hypothetical protein [Aquabacterium sp.]